MSMTMLMEAMEEKTEESEAHRYRVGREASETMEHNEAIDTMAAEKYLLDELGPEAREAYEEHYFGCMECALDVQSGAAFIEQSKKILPQMMAAPVKPTRGKRNWFGWMSGWSPLVFAPAFACLLVFAGYQNLVVYPALEQAASEPRVLPTATVLHDATRGGNAAGVPVIQADLKLGTTIQVELPTETAYPSYKFEFFNSRGKLIWAHVSPNAGGNDGMMSLWLPGRVKQDTYTLAVSGVTASGEVVPVRQQKFDLELKK